MLGGNKSLFFVYVRVTLYIHQAVKSLDFFAFSTSEHMSSKTTRDSES